MGLTTKDRQKQHWFPVESLMRSINSAAAKIEVRDEQHQRLEI